LRDDIVERFYYTPEKRAEQPLHHESDVQMELLIIGRKVSWAEAMTLCPFYDDSSMARTPFDPEVALESPAKMKYLMKESDTKNHNSTLAIFSEEEEANWLAHMLSESNYRAFIHIYLRAFNSAHFYLSTFFPNARLRGPVDRRHPEEQDQRLGLDHQWQTQERPGPEERHLRKLPILVPHIHGDQLATELLALQ
jgi:hypothetical protein